MMLKKIHLKSFNSLLMMNSVFFYLRNAFTITTQLTKNFEDFSEHKYLTRIPRECLIKKFKTFDGYINKGQLFNIYLLYKLNQNKKKVAETEF